MVQKLIITKGLPASGKTTWAKEQVENGNGNVKRVNKDDLRAMIDIGKHSKFREKTIVAIEIEIVDSLLEAGNTVIVDDTNFNYEDTWIAVAGENGVEFEVKDFTHVPLKECLRRNEERGLKVPQRAIRDMYNRYVRKAPVYEDSDYIICDIDGTLAHMEGRSPYDGSKVYKDKVDLPVKHLITTYSQIGLKVIIVTARDEQYREVTEKWLQDNNIYYNKIFFRPEGDNRCDSVVKREILDTILKYTGGKKPLFVLDDRDRVVNMWRSLGIKCLQVEPGDF